MEKVTKECCPSALGDFFYVTRGGPLIRPTSLSDPENKHNDTAHSIYIFH